MLDVSIKHLSKATAAEKKALAKSKVTVTEKLDGTKLSIIRNYEPYDPTDYRKNWIVAYKGSVITPEEVRGFDYFTYRAISEKSCGIAQYALVHAHLQVVHSRAGSVHPGTELFCEFIMRKPTVLRDYTHKHGIFLIGHAISDIELSKDGMRVTTFPTSEMVTSGPRSEHLADVMCLKKPPILFEGIFGRWNEWESKGVDHLKSSLGGVAEGVVISCEDGSLYKIVARDQCDKEARRARKAQFTDPDPIVEAEYWESVKRAARAEVEFSKGTVKQRLQSISLRAPPGMEHEPGMAEDVQITRHTKKRLINWCDDVVLTAKLMLEAESHLELPNRAKRIGYIPMAGKPVHKGHWDLIKIASSSCDKVHVIVSTKDRDGITGSQMHAVWRDILRPALRDNVEVSFSDSPTREVIRRAESALERDCEVMIFGDNQDVGNTWSAAKLAEVFDEAAVASRRVRGVPIFRFQTVKISATEMRAWMKQGKRESFESMLPDVPNKERVWEMLAHT